MQGTEPPIPASTLQAHAATAAMLLRPPHTQIVWYHIISILRRQNILSSALTLLSTQPDLSSRTASDALAAVALLEGQHAAAALQAFLSARKQWVQQQLEQAAASQEGEQPPGAVLAQLAQSVQSCIAQVGSMSSCGVELMPSCGESGVMLCPWC